MVLNQPLYGRHHPTAQPFCAMPVVNTSSKPFVFWRCFIRMDSLSSFHPSEKGKYPLKVGNSFFTYLTDSLNLAPDFQRKHSRVWRSPKPHLWAQYKWEPLKSNSCTFKLPRSLQMRAEDRLKESKWTSWKILSETKHTKKDPISMKKLRLLSQPWTPSSNYWVFQHLLKVNTIFQSKNCGWRTLAEGHLPKKKKGSWGCYRSASLLIAAVTLLPLVRARMSDRLVPGHLGIYECQYRRVLGRQSWITGSQQCSSHANESSLTLFLNWVKVGHQLKCTAIT